jgi:NAD dependent epimerase/dehydratase
MNLANKKILITGADGFIGSHLVGMMLDEGYDVRAFVCYNSNNNWGWLDTFDKKTLKELDVVAGDIRDPSGVKEAMRECDVVLHLAALIAVPFSYTAPDTYVDTNVKGTLNVLQASRELCIERVITTSTSEVYGTAQYVPIDELHALQAQSPYSATKIAADKLSEAYYKSFNTPVIIARPFNAYGPRQSARAIIPTLISQLLSGNENIKVGSLTPTRDFNYVTDITRGFIEIAKNDSLIGEVVNIATGVEISIEDLAKLLIQKINPNAKLLTDEIRFRPDKSEVFRLLGNSKKLQEHTNWSARVQLEKGLDMTIDWFKENNHQYKTWVYNK